MVRKATQKDVDNYLGALKDAVKRRDKKMTKALLRPFAAKGGKLSDLYNMRTKLRKCFCSSYPYFYRNASPSKNFFYNIYCNN